MKQNITPIQFSRTTRYDRAVGMTSGRAGRTVPFHVIPLHRGDSMSGRIQGSVDLAEMPKPLQNAVGLNVQAWFVPRSALPHFAGYDEFMASFHGEDIEALGQTTRTPPSYFRAVGSTSRDVYQASQFAQALGLHFPSNTVNCDYLDAYNTVWNHRAAAHSQRIPRRSYSLESVANASTLAQAFWPTGRFSYVVPDYERALVIGSLDLDIASGRLPVSGIGVTGATDTAGASVKETGGGTVTFANAWRDANSTSNLHIEQDAANVGFPAIFAELAGQEVLTSLATLDKARETQAFAKLMTTYAGIKGQAFTNGDTLVAELMQGFRVPLEHFKRPWLLDSAKVTFGMLERHATDAANLDDSVTKGKASFSLSLNVPQNETGGVVICTIEVLPERLYERAGDNYMLMINPENLPNALRDIQRPEPVDQVTNFRIDARHTSPTGLFGWEPMNMKWNRDITRLGGKFYQADPSNPYREARSGIWMANVVDPSFTSSHYLAPVNFPHDVFSDTLGDAFECSFRCMTSIRGLTQVGDVLHEANDEFATVDAE